MNDIIAGLSQECFLSTVSEPGLDGRWISIPKSVFQNVGEATFQLVRPARWMALERYLPWWPKPVFGRGAAAAKGEFFLVLWEREEGGYGVVLPLIDGDLRGVLHGESEGWSVRVPENDPIPDRATLLFVATGNDPVALIERSMAKIAERLGTFRLRTQKPVPRWVDYLGWCTWDAFRQEVTAEKVLDGLTSFQRGGVTPRFLILDDGWQDEKGGQLWSFRTHPKRFPQGLKPLVDRARADYGVQLFGVWHAFEGYWNGVNPEGELAGSYRIVNSEGRAYNLPNADLLKRSLVHPDDIGRFYDDYHRLLREQGVDMLKVDNQASLDHFCTREVPPTATMRAYQNALQNSERAHFRGESLHCMSNTTEIAYHLSSATVWRSSQDFFPAKPETQGLHVFDNAFNALWVQTFALPDWDMFQTAHPAGAFHAAARAISGGPVYVSDNPERHDFGLLSKLMVSDGRVLRSLQPALPARNTLFEDGRAQPLVTKIVNFNEVAGWPTPIGVLGLFNCYYGENGAAAVCGEYGVADMSFLSAPRYALYHHVSGRAVVAGRVERFPIRLENLGYELVTAAPMEQGVALFGLLDKFNGSRALESAHWISESALELSLMDGGRIGWCSEKTVREASFQELPVEVTSKGPLSWVTLPEGAPVTLRLRFE